MVTYLDHKVTVENMRNFSKFLMFKSKSDFGRKKIETGDLSLVRGRDRIYCYFLLFAELSPYHGLSSLYC
jgi:hypothetical protein